MLSLAQHVCGQWQKATDERGVAQASTKLRLTQTSDRP